jgi:glucose/arabinose dehydrogenase
MAFARGWFFLGNTDAVLRYPYREAEDGSKDIQLGKPERITQLPGHGYNQHWTRNVVVAPGGDKLYASVGSASNVEPEELPRASVLQMNLDGSQREVFAFGLRNPVGLDFHPQTGRLYTTVNERDGLGDNLVPDYLARLEKGQFYGWPYAYLTPENLDPRRMDDGKSERPELVERTETPEVLFESHSAALGLAFYEADAFPEQYRNGAFVAFRGSWNRHQGTGYKVVFVPFDDQGRAKGYYEDFVRGFLLEPAVPKTWGRPVGVLVIGDGSLLFTEEGNGRIYRVWYSG